MTLTADRARWILLAALALTFAPFVGAELFWDDFSVIRSDGPIASLSTVVRAFTGRCVLFPAGQYAYYRPIVDILLTLEFAVSGTHPLLYHFTNFLIHAANALLTFELFRRIPRATTTTALAGAAVFALHPIQCESVMWTAARPAMLATFFSLLALHAALLADGGLKWCIASIAAFILALGSKEIAVAVVPVAWLAMLSSEIRPRGRALGALIATSAIVILYLILNRAAGESASGVLGWGAEKIVDRFVRFTGFYTRQFAWPLELSPFYPLGVHEAPWCLVAGTIVIIGVIGFAGLCLAKHTPRRVLTMCGLALAAGSALLPHLAGQLGLADRYLYQSLWGVGLIIAAAAPAILERWETLRGPFGRLLIIAMLALSGLCLRQSFFWLRGEYLWARAVEIHPSNIKANLALGIHLRDRGDVVSAVNHFRAAAFADAIGLQEDRARAAFALGRIDAARDDWNEASRAFAVARAFSPALAREALVWQAISEYQAGRSEEAVSVAAQFDDDGRQDAALYRDLALIYWRAGKDRERALALYRQARARGAGITDELEQLERPATAP